ncbi:hypothetical protein JAAARDRAFT_28696 [Jaapia argillacea MUCL 33604]|uniref:Uncharacterized protein n=1 Tax=Jaapia argillacea MUCL 33604 TaxID=933084 RepID=A0A067QDL7_9AGAM|nr:hypothetical protein JAAARDRAFT_28696 [Jaapia argillacea MUCL 33604]
MSHITSWDVTYSKPLPRPDNVTTFPFSTSLPPTLIEPPDMGTRGYKVYRHRGYYFVYYNHNDSYPRVLGLDMLSTIPRDPKRFQRWVTRMRERLDGILESSEEHDVAIQQEQPQNDLLIEWIYEIDFDHFVFHVDSEPLFRLDNMPPEYIFLGSIGFDHYGHRSYRRSTPEEYRYEWRSPPPVVDVTAIEEYVRLCPGAESSISDLLSLNNLMSDREAVRIGLWEVVVGSLMRSSDIAHRLLEWETYTDRDGIPTHMHKLALQFLQISAGPMLALSSIMNFASAPEPLDLTQPVLWVRGDICARVTTHLDDESNRRACVVTLIEECKKRSNDTSPVFGIAFSFYHIVIVSIQKNMGGDWSIRHTEALQYLPSFFATSPSTPGITALGQLFNRHDPHIFEACFDLLVPEGLRYLYRILPLPETCGLSRLPAELWDLVCGHLTNPRHLIQFGCISKETRGVASFMLMHPHVAERRLVARTKPRSGYSASRSPGGQDSDDDSDEEGVGLLRLSSGTFIAIKDDSATRVRLGHQRQMGLGVTTVYMRLTADELGQLGFVDEGVDELEKEEKKEEVGADE